MSNSSFLSLRKFLKEHLVFSTVIFLLILSIPAIWGIIHSGFFVSDDGNWMVIRFSAFYEALRNGQFPVRFLARLNNGFGYPVADFLYPLFMYFGVPIHVLGLSFANTIKTVLVLSLISSSVFCFFWLRKLFDNFSSFIGAVFYTFFPYHLYDVYKRGSVGEVLSLAILPFVLWQIERKSLFWIAIGISLLILAHNALAALFLPVILLYMALDIFIAKFDKKLIYKYFLALILSFGLSAFFWIPAVYDLQYTVFAKTQVSDWSVYFASLNLIGYSTFLVIIIGLIMVIADKIRLKKHRLTVLLTTLGLISIFLSSTASNLLWNILPASFVQFPFRFLSIAMICFAFLAACIVSVLSEKKQFLMGLLILVVVFFSAVSYLLPKSFQYFPDSFYSTNQDTTTVKNEYMPKWVSTVPHSMSNAKVEVVNGQEKIQSIQITPNKINFEVNLPTERTIQVNTVYFPGWEAFVNGHLAKIDYQLNGLIRFNLAKGHNSVIVSFGETPVRIISDLVSLGSFVILLGLVFIKRKNKSMI